MRWASHLSKKEALILFILAHKQLTPLELTNETQLSYPEIRRIVQTLKLKGLIMAV